jgi:large subunit ribosomal protein L30
MDNTKKSALPTALSAPKQRAVAETSKQKFAVPEKSSFSEKKKEPKELKEVKGKLALILVRGLVRIRTEIVATLYTLRLRQSHACVIIDDTPSNRASAVKCKDYLTYGEINDETYKLLVEKRGKKDKEGKLKKYFLLHPPRGGFERKGIKTPFSTGGALGYRGAKINDLIKKML